MAATPKRPTLSIVIPCYNEEQTLVDTNRKLSALLGTLIKEKLIDQSSFLFYVDDGSRDKTWEVIKEMHAKHTHVCGISLTANAGHQKALLAGMLNCKKEADVIITIDADLQDDITAIREMMRRYEEGYEIVYGVRKSRQYDSFMKKNSALQFYKLMAWLGVKTIYNHADYRLMSYKSVCQLEHYRERNLFLRGIVPLLSSRTTSVYYSRSERSTGESHYPLSKMLNLAIDGITSFSIRPLRLITGFGFLFLLFSIMAVLYTLLRWAQGNTVEGWASLMISLWFLSSAVLIALGIVGEYVGKIYMEVKDRPHYTVEEVLKH